MRDVERIREEKKAWEQKNIRGAAERIEPKHTASGIPAPLLATPADAGADYLEDVGFPGEFPFTRGVYPTMHVGRHWTMRQYAGFGSAEESNRRFKFLLEQGQTGLSVAFDLPTQCGYDSDNADVEAEVGRLGVTIDTIRDMELLFDGIPLDRISTSFTINATAAVILAMYAAVAERQNVSADRLRGTLQNDILKEYIARGAYIFPPEPSMRLVTDVIEYCAEHAPRFNPISICGYHMRDAGCSAVNELAFTLGDALEYVDRVIERGISVDRFAPRLSFMFATHSDFFEEVAKYRAARRLWARIMTGKYGAGDPKSAMLRFHTQTAGSSVTQEQPLNNIARITVQALAAVLGGAQSLHACSYDEAYTIPTEETARISLRTQQIIAHESGVANTVDPLGGSYYVEHLTDRIEQEAREKLEKIAARGGMVRLIERGEIQREIMMEAYEYEKSIQSGDRVIVGRNKYKLEKDLREISLHELNPAHVEKAKERLKKVREERDRDAVERALAALGEAARGTDNLMPFILDAVRTCATVGEITDTLKGVFGEFRDEIAL
ncbi:MAG: methylmalonyl-CoA mutase family protein [bacterium]